MTVLIDMVLVFVIRCVGPKQAEVPHGAERKRAETVIVHLCGNGDEDHNCCNPCHLGEGSYSSNRDHIGMHNGLQAGILGKALVLRFVLSSLFPNSWMLPDSTVDKPSLYQDMSISARKKKNSKNVKRRSAYRAKSHGKDEEKEPFGTDIDGDEQMLLRAHA